MKKPVYRIRYVDGVYRVERRSKFLFFNVWNYQTTYAILDPAKEYVGRKLDFFEEEKERSKFYWRSDRGVPKMENPPSPPEKKIIPDVPEGKLETFIP